MTHPDDSSHDDHHHPHATAAAEGPPGYYEVMETSIRELLVERGLIQPGEIRRQIEVYRLKDARPRREGCRSGLDRPCLQSPTAGGWARRLRGTRHQLLRRHGLDRVGKHREAAQPYRLHPVLLLPATRVGTAPRLVQAQALSGSRHIGAEGGAR